MNSTPTSVLARRIAALRCPALAALMSALAACAGVTEGPATSQGGRDADSGPEPDAQIVATGDAATPPGTVDSAAPLGSGPTMGTPVTITSPPERTEEIARMNAALGEVANMDVA